MTENEMVGWHYRLNGQEFEQTQGDSENREAWRAVVQGSQSTTQLTRVLVVFKKLGSHLSKMEQRVHPNYVPTVMFLRWMIWHLLDPKEGSPLSFEKVFLLSEKYSRGPIFSQWVMLLECL